MLHVCYGNKEEEREEEEEIECKIMQQGNDVHKLISFCDPLNLTCTLY